MGTFNYRILAHEDKNDDIFLEVTTVYYDDNGVPNGYADKGHSPGGETKDEVELEIKKMLKCLKSPMLWAGDKFPKIYEELEE